MLRLVVLSCALAVSCGNYAGNKDPSYPKVSGSVPKILNPGNPIDPRNVQNVGPVLKPGDIINPVVIDNNQVGPLGDQWVDNIPGAELGKSWVDTTPDDPLGDPWINGQPIPFPGQNIDGRPIQITKNDGQIFNNPFINGPGSTINPIRQKPSYDNSVKPIPPVKNPSRYGGPVRKVPDNTPFVPGVGGDIFNPDFPINPTRKTPSYDNSHKLVPIPPLKKTASYDGLDKSVSGRNPFVPGLDGGIIEPEYPVDPVRKVQDYGKSHKVPVPPVKKPAGYDGPISVIPDNTPFVPDVGGEIVNPDFPLHPVRKAPSYDNSHKLVRIPPLRKSASYDGLVKSVSENNPFVPGIESGIFKPDFPADPLRKAPSYDNSHKVPIPPVNKPASYDGPVKTVSDNIPFVPAVGGEIFNPDLPVDPVRRAPSYDNSHKIPVPPVKKPSYDSPFKGISDNTPFVPGLGGEIFNPVDPIRKAPSYGNSHKVGPIDTIRKAPSYDNSHKIVPDVSPFGPIDPPLRKAPGYDNSQGVGGGIVDILPPVIPPTAYPSVAGSPIIGGQIPGEFTESGTGIDAHLIDAQKQRFEELVSARLGTRSENSPAALPKRKELSAGKRNYLSSLGIFKKAKSYQS
ncbi:uncharacterized protein LOC133181678 [Saccostrea echinata]|uniref:uncharacterized protein LOC133181678 n=1 Tax=Saccostrea echinata TaxID=191078 RepID=UPI002A81C3EE|nr:uncharacterized protein LOC133181678 [Saccostrea echinata]